MGRRSVYTFFFSWKPSDTEIFFYILNDRFILIDIGPYKRFLKKAYRWSRDTGKDAQHH